MAMTIRTSLEGKHTVIFTSKSDFNRDLRHLVDLQFSSIVITEECGIPIPCEELRERIASGKFEPEHVQSDWFKLIPSLVGHVTEDFTLSTCETD